MAEFVALPELTKALHAAVNGSKSGAFFITSPEQHSAMITLDKGHITGVKYRNTRGYDAAKAIAALDRVRFQTGAEPTELPGQVELDTRTVLATLGSSSSESEATASAAGDDSPTAGIGAATDEDLSALRERYIAAIGPIGGALFDEEYEAMGGNALSRADYASLVEKLAEQIDDEGEARRFRKDARLD